MTGPVLLSEVAALLVLLAGLKVDSLSDDDCRDTLRAAVSNARRIQRAIDRRAAAAADSGPRMPSKPRDGGKS